MAVFVLLVSICVVFFIIHHIEKKKHLEEKRLQQIKEEEEKQERIKNEKEEIRKYFSELMNDFEKPIKSIHVNISLDKNEEAYFFIENVSWNEARVTRSKTTVIDDVEKDENDKYSGEVQVYYSSERELKEIAIGDLYITNKRLLLISDDETKNIKLDAIIDISYFMDALSVKRTNGKAVIFQSLTSKENLKLCLHIARVKENKTLLNILQKTVNGW